jgi:hypothetical protein
MGTPLTVRMSMFLFAISFDIFCLFLQDTAGEGAFLSFFSTNTVQCHEQHGFVFYIILHDFSPSSRGFCWFSSEKFDSLTNYYCRNAHGACICYGTVTHTPPALPHIFFFSLISSDLYTIISQFRTMFCICCRRV